MNASVGRYPAKEIPRPKTVLDVEICSSSGYLATEKCPADKTYRELATKEQMPVDPCNVHGDARARIVQDLPDAGVPRAALAVDTNQVKPVALKGPTLLAENDPYNAIRSTVKPPKPADAANNEVKPIAPAETRADEVAAQEEAQILRAEPVAPTDLAPEIADERATEVRRAEPVLRAEPVQPADPVPRATQRPQTLIPRAEPRATVPRARFPDGRAVPRAQPVDPRATQPRRAVPAATPDEEFDE
jgi:hypothetical protein